MVTMQSGYLIGKYAKLRLPQILCAPMASFLASTDQRIRVAGVNEASWEANAADCQVTLTVACGVVFFLSCMAVHSITETEGLWRCPNV